MAVYKLRFDPDLPDQRQQVTLGNKRYQIRTYWNARTRHWYMDVYTEGGEPVCVGEALTPGALPGNGNLDFPPTLVVVGPEPQEMADLWDGRLTVIYAEPNE